MKLRTIAVPMALAAMFVGCTAQPPASPDNHGIDIAAWTDTWGG